MQSVSSQSQNPGVAVCVFILKRLLFQRNQPVQTRTHRGVPQRFEVTGPRGAADIVGLASARDRLIAVTASGELRRRLIHWDDVPWTRFAAADDVIALTSLGDRLFAATRDGKLLTRTV